MTLEAGWLKRQLDRVADDVDKWPEWMKREAEFGDSNAAAPGPVRDLEGGPERALKAGCESQGWD